MQLEQDQRCDFRSLPPSPSAQFLLVGPIVEQRLPRGGHRAAGMAALPGLAERGWRWREMGSLPLPRLPAGLFSAVRLPVGRRACGHRHTFPKSSDWTPVRGRDCVGVTQTAHVHVDRLDPHGCLVLVRRTSEFGADSTGTSF